MTADRDQFLALRVAQALIETEYRGKPEILNHSLIATVLKHAAIDWERHQKVEKAKSDKTVRLDDILHEPVIPDPTSEEIEARDTAAKWSSMFAEPQRKNVLAFRLQGYSYREIAELVKLTEDRVAEIVRSMRKTIDETL